MPYVFESLDEFLNEDLGTLQKFNLPQNLIQKIVGQHGYLSKVGGRESTISIIDDPTNYKNLLNSLKDDFTVVIISVNGEAKYLFQRESERKFNMFEIEVARKEEEAKLKRKKESDEREKQRKLEREQREKEQNQNLSEARRRVEYHEPGGIGSYSVKDIIEKIKKLEGEGAEVLVEIIGGDPERSKKIEKRRQMRMGEDPLYIETRYYSAPSQSQQTRYKKYTTKKRLEIDKKIEAEKDKLRNQIIDNFDETIDSVIKSLRQGYSWYAKKDEIGKKLLDNVDLTSFKKLAAAYDAIEPGSQKGDSAKASRELKKLGYLNK